MTSRAPYRAAGFVVALLILAVCAAPASAQKLRQPSAGSALKQLVSQTNKLPSSAATKKQKAKLKKAAATARRSARKQPCTSVRQLATFRRVLRGIKVKKGRRNRTAINRLRALGPTSMSASRALLAGSRTKRCGGGVKPSKLETAQTTILQNDANGMKLRVDLPALRFVDEEGGGRTWTKLVLPETDSPADPGSPAIPTVAKTLGVPEGASMKVEATDTTSYTIDGVDVFPAQPDPVDQGGPGVDPAPEFDEPPFTRRPFLVDGAEYRKRGNVPAQPADGAILGQSRDLTLGNLQIPAAQYNPAAKRLRVMNSVEVTVAFEGGSKKFSEQLQSPWEAPQRSLRNSLLNSAVVFGDLPTILERCGEEMIVITNPSTIAAANTFASAKRAQGMRTSVFQTGAGPGQIGTTAGQIQTLIRNHLTAGGCIRPSYVTILGDDELVPTFPGINGIASDLEYSLRDGADELSDVAVGRIVGNDAAGVTTAINKIISYENTPPGGPWLRRAAFAAQFQDTDGEGQVNDGQENRTFTLFAERARSGILNTPGGFGLSVDRIYEDSPTTTPLKFNDGTDLPAALKKPTFAWDGDGADVTAAWNEGRYLMVHRDHGWNDGWGDPYFDTNNVNALTNGNLLPVLMSINCASGAFDTDDTSFATQALVNPNGGAVGVFGDTRNSPSWHNTQIGWGFLDGLLPRVLAGEGPATKQRVGNALINGKNRLAGLSPPAGDGNTRNELYLWHYFGDPSMQMWGGEPIKLPVLTDFRAQFVRDFVIGPPRPDPPPYGVEVSLPAEFNGQAFSLLRNGEVIGKGVAADGKARVPAAFDNSQPKKGELQVAFEGDGAVPITIPVDGVPEEQKPPPGKTATQLSIACPEPVSFGGEATINGTLSPGFAGATIELTYTTFSNTTFQRTATTNSNGQWSDTVDTGSFENDPQGGGNGGTWTVSASYAGDSTHTGSGPQSCTFEEESG